MNTIDEMIEVLQAMKEGKVIECRELTEDGYDSWDEMRHRCPDFSSLEYRVKKEPRVIWGLILSSPQSFRLCESEDDAKDLRQSYISYGRDARVAEFIEVIE